MKSSESRRDLGLLETVREGDLVVLCDPLEPAFAEQVTGPDPAGRLLLRLTPRGAVRSALDLGCGNGIQALHLATHSERVVATDVNPRATEMTARSAALNGLDNIETRTGDWLEPMVGETFDLVVCNPPYVISPDHELVYRDAPEPGDAVCAGLAAEIPTVLAPGGTAVMLANWVVPDGGSWTGPPRAWTDGNGCDVIALRMAVESADSYARRWCGPVRDSDPRRHDTQLERWTRWYGDNSIERIASGALALRARPRADGFKALDLPGGVQGDSGDHVDRVLRALGDPISDDGILAARLSPAEDLRIEIAPSTADAPGDDPVLVNTTGLGQRFVLPAPADAFVEALDGAATVLQASELSGLAPNFALDLGRRLVDAGLMTVAPARPAA